MNNKAIIIRHDTMVKFFMDHIDQSKHPKLVMMSENNKNGELKPDLEFYYKG